MSKADRTMGDIDEASSKSQVSNVYKPSATKDPLAYKDVDEGHGGINSTVEVPQTNDVIRTTSHDNGPFRNELDGGL